MKKYKLLRFNHCYINDDEKFVICLLEGNKKDGYKFLGRYKDSMMPIQEFTVFSRIVPNDDHWKEIDPELYLKHFMFA